jgi:hypothetical protein
LTQLVRRAASLEDVYFARTAPQSAPDTPNGERPRA